VHVTNDIYLAENLERLAGSCQQDQQADIAVAFVKFAVVTKELSALMKNLVSCFCSLFNGPRDAGLNIFWILQYLLSFVGSI